MAESITMVATTAKALESKGLEGSKTMKNQSESASQHVDSITTSITTDDSISSYEANIPDGILMQLARQLEYYFSDVNLSKDTYLRTLRELNDGYVLASILANFAKVQSLCPVDSYHAVVKAAREYSDNLEVVFLNKETSKRVDERDGTNTLLAVGPMDSKPIPMSSSSSSSSSIFQTQMLPISSSALLLSVPSFSSLSATVANTVILRDVPHGVTEEDIRSLFDNELSPIQAIHEDVANCWFVTFDSTTRDEMVDVMLGLRSKTLKGDPVKARLKNAGPAPSSLSPVPPTQPPGLVYDYHHQGTVYAGDRNLPYGRGKQPHGNKKGGSTKPSSPRSSSMHNKDGKKLARRNRKKQQQTEARRVQPPPPLVESQFPALVETKDLVVEEEKSPVSDAASTATTSTSSSAVSAPKKQQQPSGYAAALLKAPSTKPTNNNNKQPNNDKKDKDTTTTPPHRVESVTTDHLGKEPSKSQAENASVGWGGGRSFAEVLLKKRESATKEAS